MKWRLGCIVVFRDRGEESWVVKIMVTLWVPMKFNRSANIESALKGTIACSTTLYMTSGLPLNLAGSS